VSGDVVGDVPCAADAPSRRNTNEHTAIAKTHDVMLLQFDIQLFGLYEKCNGIFDPDALCHFLKQPAAVRSSSEAVALCNLMETITFCQVIPPQLMFEWCRMLEFSTFQENDILQEQNSFHFSDFAVFVIISGTVHEHAQPDTQDPDFERFKEHINTILPLQKDQHAAKSLTSAARTDYLGPFIRSIGVGEVFGDRGILSKRCRQSTVIADSSKVRCMKITRKKFTEFTKLMPSLAAQPDVVWQLMQTHADRRSEQEKSELLVQLQRLPAFSALPADTIADIASASRGSSFNIGDVVLPVDDDSRYFGIILEGEMASFSRDEAALAAFPGMQVNRYEGSNKIEQERLKLMQQRYGTILQKYSHGSIVGVGALWLPETSCVARLDSSAALKGKSEQDAPSEGIPTAYETVAVKGGRVRRTMSFASMTKGLQVIIVDAQALNSAKSVLKNTESFMPSQLLATLERPPNLRNFHERLSLTAYLLTFKYCQRLPAATVSDLAKHIEVSLRKKGECVQRQGARPSTFVLTFKGSVSLFRVPHPPRRDDDDDDDDLRWGDEGASQHGSGFEEDHAKTKSRGGSPRSKGVGSRHGSKRLSPSPPRTAAMSECAVPSSADTDIGLAGSADNGEDFAGIFGNKIGCVGVGSPIDELALVTNSLSPFTAVVTSQIARFFTLPSSVYSALLQRFHREELSKLCKDLIQRVPVFRSWVLPKVMNLIRFFEPKQYFRGQTLLSQSCNQKNEHRRILIILDGNCAVEADLPRSFDYTLENEIKLRQKEELEDESLRSLSFSHDSSPKTGVRKLRQLKRAVITMFGHSTVLLDGFASQPLSYDIVATEGVSCLELSGEEFSKVSNSTLEYIAEQESMTNSWRSTVVAKLAVIRAPDFTLTKAVTEVDVDSMVDAINAKKKQEQRAARERSSSPKDKTRRNLERQKGATVASEHEVSLQPSKHSPSPTLNQRSKHGQSALEATLVPSFQSPISNSFGTVSRASFETSSKLHNTCSDDWWTSMGIEGMQGTKSFLALQTSGLDAPHLSPATAAAVTPTREHARATFGVKVKQIMQAVSAYTSLCI
jgi:CRP-like cAMP-binding protein